MDLQVDVSNEMNPTDQTMDDQSRVSAFKQVWMGLRDQLVQIQSDVDDYIGTIKNLCSAQGALLDYFRQAALNVSADYSSYSAVDLANKAVSGAPSDLAVVWANYSSDFYQFDIQISDFEKKIEDCKTQAAATNKQIETLKSQYESFHAEAVTPVPAPKALQADVMVGDTLFKATPANITVADASVLDDFNDSTNAAILNAQVSADESLDTALETVSLPRGRISPMTLGIGLLALVYLLK